MKVLAPDQYGKWLTFLKLINQSNLLMLLDKQFKKDGVKLKKFTIQHVYVTLDEFDAEIDQEVADGEIGGAFGAAAKANVRANKLVAFTYCRTKSEDVKIKWIAEHITQKLLDKPPDTDPDGGYKLIIHEFKHAKLCAYDFAKVKPPFGSHTPKFFAELDKNFNAFLVWLKTKAGKALEVKLLFTKC